MDENDGLELSLGQPLGKSCAKAKNTSEDGRRESDVLMNDLRSFLVGGTGSRELSGRPLDSVSENRDGGTKRKKAAAIEGHWGQKRNEREDAPEPRSVIAEHVADSEAPVEEQQDSGGLLAMYPGITAGLAAEVKFGGSGSCPDLPWVSTSASGRTISGVTYRFSPTQVKIVCACHGLHLLPEEFITHGGEERVCPTTSDAPP